VKHFEYIWYGCWMHSKGVWSFNHDITTSIGLNHPQFSLNPSSPAQA
jgi:hypothetical protein